MTSPAPIPWPFTPVLASLITNIDLLSRTNLPSSTLTNSLKNIGLIELVTSSSFALYNPLYIQTFPNTLERERSDLITTRLDDEHAGRRRGLSPYHIVGLRDHTDQAIGACHFSVLFLSGYAVPYIQYIYIRESNRKQNLSGLLHMLTLVVATADANDRGFTVPLILFETEPAGYGNDEHSRQWASTRSAIHSRGGAVALMLERDGVLISPHVQPGLEVGEGPLSLVWVVRPNPAHGTVDIESLGDELIAAYYQSLRDEGFPEENIRRAERIVEGRRIGGRFILMPLGDVVLGRESRIDLGQS